MSDEMRDVKPPRTQSTRWQCAACGLTNDADACPCGDLRRPPARLVGADRKAYTPPAVEVSTDVGSVEAAEVVAELLEAAEAHQGKIIGHVRWADGRLGYAEIGFEAEAGMKLRRGNEDPSILYPTMSELRAVGRRKTEPEPESPEEPAPQRQVVTVVRLILKEEVARDVIFELAATPGVLGIAVTHRKGHLA